MKLRSARWRWSQRWWDVLFLHWKVPVDSVARQLPCGLEVDEWSGATWISLVLFRIKVRPLGLPYLPSISSLTELNYRVYVHCNGQPGIHFLRMYGDNFVAIRLARFFTPLPYEGAQLNYRWHNDTLTISTCMPTNAGDSFPLTCRPTGPLMAVVDDSLDAWLLERYHAFVIGQPDQLLAAQVSHPSWQVQRVEIVNGESSKGRWLGIGPDRRPDAMHFSTGVHARFSSFEPVACSTLKSEPIRVMGNA